MVLTKSNIVRIRSTNTAKSYLSTLKHSQVNLPIFTLYNPFGHYQRCLKSADLVFAVVAVAVAANGVVVGGGGHLPEHQPTSNKQNLLMQHNGLQSPAICDCNCITCPISQVSGHVAIDFSVRHVVGFDGTQAAGSS